MQVMDDDNNNFLDGLDIDIPDPSSSAAAGSAAADPSADASNRSQAEHFQNGAAEFFGPYQLIQQVGVGGVARVSRARHIHPRYNETTFAIKILHDDLSRDPRVVQLFRNEAYVLSMLNHSNIVQTFEAGVQDDRLFIAMEYIDGRDLDAMVHRAISANITLPIVVSLHIVAEVLKALAYAHELRNPDGISLNLVHRDVNPANVFLSYDGRVKLGDFGVAAITAGRLEESRELAGKAGYFAPEQLLGEEVDHRADIFAIGVMLFEVLTGKRLFDGKNINQVMRQNKRARIPKPTKFNKEIPAEVEKIILKALDRKPAGRYSTAKEMLSALEAFVPHTSGMPLAVAALMRKVFQTEHIEELQLVEGLAGGPTRGSGQSIGLCSPDPRAQSAFSGLLSSRGYKVQVYDAMAKLDNPLRSENPPALLLIDVTNPDFSAEYFHAMVKMAQRLPPIVAVSDELDSLSIARADSLGAVDLLFKPFNVERALTAVRAAISGTSKIKRTSLIDSAPISQEERHRLLLISKDPSLISRLSTGLNDRGFRVETISDPIAALKRNLHASYDSFLLDADPPDEAAHLFPSLVREQIGMGIVPVVFLIDPETGGQGAGLEGDRSTIRHRTDGPVVLAEIIRRLSSDTRTGRTFVRFPALILTEFRYGGRVFEGAVTDISRGGVMLNCNHMPPIGTMVSVSMRLPNSATPIEAKGAVVRVDLPETPDAKASIGVNFQSFAGDNETYLIEYLATLENKPSQPQSAFFQSPSINTVTTATTATATTATTTDSD
ncbi:protein kinase [Myxococcota bacterium]|nr:protein kinase [Myxococcota bacterium]